MKRSELLRRRRFQPVTLGPNTFRVEQAQGLFGGQQRATGRRQGARSRHMSSRLAPARINRWFKHDLALRNCLVARADPGQLVSCRENVRRMAFKLPPHPSPERQMTLDDVDRAIINRLCEDGRQSMRALAERLHISRAGVY